MQPLSPIRAVWFDVGGVLINETREYGTWADWLGIPRHTFSAVFGAVIARGQDYRAVFRHFRPDFDLDAARRARLDEPTLNSARSASYSLDSRSCPLADADAFLHGTGRSPGVSGVLNRRPTGDPGTSVGRPAGEAIQEHQPAGLACCAGRWLVVDDLGREHLSAARREFVCRMVTGWCEDVDA
ncbi:MAG: hypothetical protein ACRDRU_10635 [Pseudonocardiaceae bacterium]